MFYKDLFVHIILYSLHYLTHHYAQNTYYYNIHFIFNLFIRHEIEIIKGDPHVGEFLKH